MIIFKEAAASEPIVHDSSRLNEDSLYAAHSSAHFVRHNLRNRARPQPLAESNGMHIALLMEVEHFEMGVNRRRLMATSRLVRLVALEAWKKDVLDVVFEYPP